MALGLMLHKGAQSCQREDIKNYPTPEPSINENGRGHFPIPHEELVGQTVMALEHHGFAVDEQEFGITPDGAKFFGVMFTAIALIVKSRRIKSPFKSVYFIVSGFRESEE